MPGIVGIIGRGAPDEYQRLVRTMIATMMHEPSYASGTLCDPDLGVYAGWVAHPGSFAARQSTARSEGQPAVVLSGECFGESSAGAATPLDLYNGRGGGFVEALDGSFTGLLLDPRHRRGFLFNDRFGAERIYYHETGSTLYFASEAKALLGVCPQLRQLDEEGVAQFLTYGATVPERTLFRDIRVMPPASIWTFDDRVQPTKRLYFRPSDWQALPELPPSEFRERLAAAFHCAVHASAEADTPVGVSITGGLDTRMIMACMPRVGCTPICYTFAGIEGETLDVRLGRRVAQVCGLEHRTLRIDVDFLAAYGDFVDRTTFITDGCAGALGAHEIYLNSLARQVAPVRLTGNFGSEILRGMSTFKPADLSNELLEPEWIARVAALRSSEAARERHPVVFAAFHEIPAIHFGIPAAARSQLTFRSPFLRNEIVELAVRSPASERSSPAACAAVIERYDAALSEIPTDRGVLPQADATNRTWSRLFAAVTFKLDYWHKEGLPAPLTRLEPLLNRLSGAGLLGLHKFLPYRGWFRRELAGYVTSVLTDASTRRMPYWSARSLDRILADHQNGRRNHLREINTILTLESVNRCLLGNVAAAPGTVG